MFYKKVNKNNNREMFEFLKGHFEYHTMDSWNREKSIANNVKVYNLNLKGDEYRLLEMLELDDYTIINSVIQDWELEHKGYEVGFNGRSGGYLVLHDTDKKYRHVLSYHITDNDTYEDLKEELKYHGWTMKDYHTELVKMVELVQDFDKLCDDLVAECQYMLDNYEVAEEEIQVTKVVKVLREKEEE